MSDPTVYTAPVTEPVTLAEAKAQCRVTQSNEESLLTIYIGAAREDWEHANSQKMYEQTLEWSLDAFPNAGESIKLHTDLLPVRSVSQITYLDPDGNTQTLSSSAYALDNKTKPGYIFEVEGYSWPATADSANAVTLRIVSGMYATGAEANLAIKNWMLVEVATRFENRSATGKKIERYHDNMCHGFKVYL